MKSRILVCSSSMILILFIYLGIPLAGQPDEKLAISNTNTWLSLVDEGRYGESWDQAARFLKNAVTKEQWLKSMA